MSHDGLAMKMINNQQSNSPTVKVLFLLSGSCFSAACSLALLWLCSQEYPVDSYQEAKEKGNWRFFTGRGAVYFYAANKAFSAAACAVGAYESMTLKG